MLYYYQYTASIIFYGTTHAVYKDEEILKHMLQSFSNWRVQHISHIIRLYDWLHKFWLYVQKHSAKTDQKPIYVNVKHDNLSVGYLRLSSVSKSAEVVKYISSNESQFTKQAVKVYTMID